MKKMMTLLMALMLVVAMTAVAFAAGTEEEPYQPYGTEFTTEEIAAGTNAYFTMYRIGSMIFTINDADAYVICDGTTYNAVDGAVSFQLPPSNPMMPVTFQIGNNGTEAKTFDVTLSYPLGARENPEEVTYMGELTASLAEGNNQGYYFKWIAEGTGTLEVGVLSATEGVEYDILLMNNNTYAQKSYASDATENDYGATVVVLDVTEGDEVIIQFATMPDQNWNYPALELSVNGTFIATPGSEMNPYFGFAPEFTTEEIPADTAVWYNVPGAGEMILTINSADAYVIYNGTTYSPVDGVVTLQFDPVMGGRMPVAFQIGNNGSEVATFDVLLEYPAGHMMNPEVVTDISELDAALAEGNTSGYFYTWTATEDGTVNFEITDVTEGVEADVMVSNGTTYEYLTLSSDGVDGVLSMDVTAGDVLTIQICALPDQNWNYPAADITVSGEYEGEEILPTPTPTPEAGDEEPPTGDAADFAVFVCLAGAALLVLVASKKARA